MLNINKKSDIVIPFERIGEDGWESNSQIIIDSIAENWGKLATVPIAETEICKLEDRLGTSLPTGLRMFYLIFGLADIGEQLQPFDEINWLKAIWVKAPDYGPDFTEKDRECLPYLVTFSDYLGNGNMFCFHSETKEIYYFDHDQRPYLTKLFDVVDDYLRGCLIFAQADLFGDVNQEEVDGWIEDLLTGLFGTDIIRKWIY